MDYISRIKKDDKEYCLGGPYYNIVLNKGDTIGDVLDQIPDFDVNRTPYEVLWSGDVFGISFGFLGFDGNSEDGSIVMDGALFQELSIVTPFLSLKSLRNYVIGDEALEAADRLPMILSNVPQNDFGNKYYNIVFKDGHIMFEYAGDGGR